MNSTKLTLNRQQLPRIKVPQRWRPPDQGVAKINTDAAFDNSTGKGSYAVVSRNHEGKILTMQAARIFATSPLAAKAISLREAVNLAANLQLPKVIFESNSLQLVNTCNEQTTSRQIQGIVDDILEMKKEFQECSFTWTKREGNRVANEIAPLSLQGRLVGNWVMSPPVSLASHSQRSTKCSAQPQCCSLLPQI